MQKIVQNLPGTLHDKWRSIVQNHKDKKLNLTFETLVDFVHREARKATDPVYGKLVLGDSKPKSKLIKPKPTGFKKNFSTSVQPATTDVAVTAQGRQGQGPESASAFKSPCLHCKKGKGNNHAPSFCRCIGTLPLKERYEFMRAQNLCYGCLKTSSRQHSKATCRQKLLCTICGRIHPTILHADPGQNPYGGSDFIQMDNNVVVNKAVGSTSLATRGHKLGSRIAMPILPVLVKAQNSDKCIQTYAFLDSGSTSTFCSENLRKQLNVEGRKTTISLPTMGNERSVDSHILKNLR
jgi:hypothetical protein